MSNKNNKKNISLIVLTVILISFIAFVYLFNNRLLNYKTSVTDDYNKLTELEKEKSVLKNYKDILSLGSAESSHVKTHILSDDRKIVLGFMNRLEDYAKAYGLIDNNNSLITSVSSRENASITKYNANDLVINIKVSGDQDKIDGFLNLLNNIPFISYVEKIDIKFDYINKKHNANITLIIYQKHESK